MPKINSELLDQQLKAEAPVAEATIPVRNAYHSVSFSR